MGERGHPFVSWRNPRDKIDSVPDGRRAGRSELRFVVYHHTSVCHLQDDNSHTEPCVTLLLDKQLTLVRGLSGEVVAINECGWRSRIANACGLWAQARNPRGRLLQTGIKKQYTLYVVYWCCVGLQSLEENNSQV